MPGPVSDPYPGPRDRPARPPRWAFPHLSDKEFEEMFRDPQVTNPAICPKCGGLRTHYRLKGYRCNRCD